MISTSTAFRTALEQSSREWRARFLYNDTDTGATTKSLTVKGGSMDDSGFNLCGVYSSSFEAVIDTLNGFSWEDKEIVPQLGLVLADSTVEWISLGLFTVTEVYSAKYQTTIKGVGRLTAKCGGQFTPPSNQTILNIQRAIATQAGVQTSRDTSLPASLVIEKDLTGLTMLEVWQVVASTLGAFVWERYDGVIRISKYPNTPNISVGADRMTEEPTFSDYDNVITGTHVIAQEASYDEDGAPIPAIEYSADPYNVTLYNPYMTETAFATFNSNLTGLTWRKASVPLALGDPRFQPNDMLAVTVDGNTYNVPCHNYIHQFDGGLKTTVTANGESESLENAQNEGAITRQLKEIVADIITAKQAILGRVKADELEADVVRIFNTLSVAKHFFVDSNGIVHITETEDDYTTGNNVVVDSDSVDIRNGEDVLASFGSTTIIGNTETSNVKISNDKIEFIGESRDSVGEIYSGRYVDVTQSKNVNRSGVLRNIGDRLEIPKERYANFVSQDGDVAVITLWGLEEYDEVSVSFENGFPVEAICELEIARIKVKIYIPSITSDETGYIELLEHSHNYDYDVTVSLYGEYRESQPYYLFGQIGEGEVGNFAFMEGKGIIAKGECSHAEGSGSIAKGSYSHAEGRGTEANGYSAHAQNTYTIANGDAQTALGHWNIADYEALVIVGNGNSVRRSNALRLLEDGEVELGLNINAISGTLDGDLYASIVALNWGNEVIV